MATKQALDPPSSVFRMTKQASDNKTNVSRQHGRTIGLSMATSLASKSLPGASVIAWRGYGTHHIATNLTSDPPPGSPFRFKSSIATKPVSDPQQESQQQADEALGPMMATRRGLGVSMVIFRDIWTQHCYQSGLCFATGGLYGTLEGPTMATKRAAELPTGVSTVAWQDTWANHSHQANFGSPTACNARTPLHFDVHG